MTVFTKSGGYGIGQVSRASGVNIETIRYYERIAIMPKPDRTDGGNRQYDLAQLKRLIFIKRSRELGFSIEEIRALLIMTDRQDFTCSEVHEMAIEHLTDIRKKLADLRQMENVLKTMAAKCSQGDIPECPIVDALSAI